MSVGESITKEYYAKELLGQVLDRSISVHEMLVRLIEYSVSNTLEMAWFMRCNPKFIENLRMLEEVKETQKSISLKQMSAEEISQLIVEATNELINRI